MPEGAATRYGSGAASASQVVGDRELLVVSNREPYSHGYDEDGEITVSRPAGGLTAALDPLLQELGGTWIAWGSGEADRDVVDEDDRVAVPPEDEAYDLRRCWLDEETVDTYYYGFANQVLWPLSHSMPTKLRYRESYWRGYRRANLQFADAVYEEASNTAREGQDQVVWLQDYHFGLAPQFVRDRLPEATIMQFWHVPWPPWDVFRRAPKSEEVLDGLLGNDVLCFHTELDRQHFVECARAAFDADFDPATGVLTTGARSTAVRAHQLGVDAETYARRAQSEAAASFWDAFATEHGLHDQHLLVGVDRLDYTKGIVERLDALEVFFAEYPERRGEVTLVEKASESRSRIPEYAEIQETVEETVQRINDRFGTDDWQPIRYHTDMLPEEGLTALYRNADAALVSSLRDGMNLVAKEYVASQVDDDGVLVLSEFAGAAYELGDKALTVNPLDTDEFAAMIERAVSMSEAERRRRMARLRRIVNDNPDYRWVENQFRTLAELEA